MSTTFVGEFRSQAMQIDARAAVPTGDEVYEGRTYFNTTNGRLYVYVGAVWQYTQLTVADGTTTSTSTTTTSSSSSSTSTTTTTSSSSTSSTSTSSTSTSTTLM